MMRPPRDTADILGVNWRIQVVEKLPGAYGDCDETQCLIRIVCGPQMRVTTFHELTHAACPALPERYVREVERGLYPALKHNPELREWMFSPEGKCR